MNIKSLYIENFRGIERLEIGNFDSQMNLFVGVNGAGKTTILAALSILFSWFLARLKNPNGKGLLLTDNDISIGAKSCKIAITLLDGTYWDICKTHAYVKKNDAVSNLEQLKGLVERIYSNEELYKTIPLIVYYPVERAVASAPVKLHKKENGTIWDAYDEALIGNADFRTLFEWYRRQEDIENEQIRDNPKFRDKSLETIRMALQKVFPEYGEMRVRRHPTQAMVICKKDNTKTDDIQIEFDQLSQGEKCYISLVCDLARRLSMANPQAVSPLRGQGIVLIDEIDLHLHPKWQVEVLSKLMTIFPQCQFVVTTHSPLVLSDVKPQQLYLLERGRLIQNSFNPYGKSSSQIMTNYFDLTRLHQRNQTISKEMESAQNALNNNDENAYKVAMEQLRENVDTNDPDMVNLQIEAYRKGFHHETH